MNDPIIENVDKVLLLYVFLSNIMYIYKVDYHL